MRRVSLAVCFVALAVATAINGCGSSSSGGGDAAATGSGGAGGTAGSAGGAGGGPAGAVTYSCNVAGSFCTELLVQPSGVSAEDQQCTTLQGGTSGTGCPTAGLLGCCQPKAGDASHEEQCYYDATEVSIAMGLCKTTWTSTM